MGKVERIEKQKEVFSDLLKELCGLTASAN